MVVRVHVHRQTDWSGPLTAALVVNLCSWCHATRPNVLMLVADDLRPEIGAFGVDTAVTPRIDKLAKESLVLTRNYVQQAVCGPTRASILTGRRPDTLRTITHSLPTYWRERAGNFTTIPQLFRENGWYTVSFGKVFDLRTSSNSSAEWICDAPYSWSEYPVFCGTVLWSLDGKMAQQQSHATLTPEQEGIMSDRQIVNAAIGRLNWSTPNHTALPTPWMVAVGLHRPHLPLIVPQSSLDLHPPSSVELPPNRFSAPKNMPLAATECAGGKVPEPGHASMELWEQYTYNNTTSDWNGWTGEINTSLPDEWAVTLKRYYQAAVSHTDMLFGEVLDAVHARGDYDNTIIVMFGDHGWHLAESGMWAKCTNFEPAARAPLMIRVPGVTDAGVTSTALSEHVDLLPTLADAAGIAVPTCPRDSTDVKVCTDGVSLLPLARSPNTIVKKAAYTQWPHPFFSQQPITMGYSIRTDTARYTEWVFMSYVANGTHIPNWSHRCAREYYNDTAETANVAEDPARAADVAYHAGLLRLGWRVAAGAAPWPTLPPLPQPIVSLTCPTTNPGPSPSPPGPLPPGVSAGASRRCSNGTAQGNSSDTSCWCQPAVTKVGPTNNDWSDCQSLCANDAVCKSWTFSTSGGCFRHSTDHTISVEHTGPTAKTIWSGCEHPDTCPNSL